MSSRASKFFERLQGIFSHLNGTQQESGLRLEGVEVRRGGDPTKNRSNLSSCRDLGIYRINYPDGLKVYVQWDEKKPEVIIPRAVSKAKEPSLLAELETLASTQSLENGLSVDEKVSGSMEYEPLELPQAIPANFEAIGEVVLAEAGEKPKQTWSVLDRIQTQLRRIEDIYVAGYRRHQEANQQVKELGERIVRSDGFQRLVEGASRISELAETFQELSYKLGKGVQGGQERLAALRRQMDEWALAVQAFALARKCPDGDLRGRMYEIVNHSPGAFSIIERASNACVMTVQQDSLLSIPKVIASSQLSSTELRAMTAQLRHINQVLGEQTVSEYINSHSTDEVDRHFANFAPADLSIEPPAYTLIPSRAINLPDLPERRATARVSKNRGIDV